MPEPWTTSASASIGADGIVTLVEGSAFCISSRSGEIDPSRPQGLFFRDTRFVSELRCTLNGAEPRAARRDRARSVQRRVRAPRPSRRRGTPTRTSCCSAGATSAGACAKTSRSRTTAKKRRSARSSWWSTPTSPTCSRSRRVASTSRASSTWTAEGSRLTFRYKRHAFERATHVDFSGSPRIHGQPRGVRDGRPAARAVVGVHRGDAGDRRPRGHAPLPVRPAGRALHAGRAARGVAGAHAGGHERRRPVPRACSIARPATSPGCASSTPSSPTARSSPRARPGS